MNDPIRKTPPALLYDWYALDAAGILEEIPCPTGVILWQLARDIVLWASTPLQDRDQLFRQPPVITADVDPALRYAVSNLLQLFASPRTMDPRSVAASCETIANWARDRGLLRTASALFQAAALSRPDSPDLTRRAGLLAVQRADHSRAETWLRRALTLSRRQQAWEAYGLSLVHLGISYRQRGSLPRAREHFLRAYKIGCRWRKRRVAALAAHDLFGLLLQMGEVEEAETWADRASRLYRTQDPEFDRFASDLAYAWMCRGEFRPALRVFEAIVHRVHTPALRLVALANIIRAAGGCGDRVAFDAAWSTIRGGFMMPGLEEVAADCWLDVAHGAASLGEWSLANQAARSALALAVQHSQSRVVFAAQALLDSVQGERTAQGVVVRPISGVDADALAERLVEVLTKVV